MVPKLKLVDSKPGSPPRPLRRAGMAAWNRITRDYDISDAAGIELLCLHCEALDFAEECKALREEYGVAVINKDTGVIRENPLCKVEIANRAQAAKLLVLLGVNQEPTKAVGRPTESWNHAKAEKSSA